MFLAYEHPTTRNLEIARESWASQQVALEVLECHLSSRASHYSAQTSLWATKAPGSCDKASAASVGLAQATMQMDLQ